ncbi:dihydrolipoamide acetyltransferase family protein [Mycolicibacterium sp.]|uniref:dihydrolipoamide acetyltransferase family protein n=1 Tax=Mycolicibacterium sp. TaxID=2320850 RepID=UPI0037CC1401
MSLIEFRLPDVGEGLSEATIVEWLVAPGDAVEEDAALVLIETDKAQVEIPSPVTGTLREVVATTEQIIAIGSVLARFETADQRTDSTDATPTEVDDSPIEQVASAPKRTRSRAQTSPFVRRYAKIHGVDLDTVPGSGRHGRITAADARRAKETKALREPTDQRDQPLSVDAAVGVDTPSIRQAESGFIGGQMSPMRRQIAATLTAAWREVPHVFDWRQADATQLIELRKSLRQRNSAAAGLTFLPLVVKLVSAAIKEHPWVNAALRDDHIIPSATHNIGIATATEQGLVVPVISGVESLTLLDLSSQLAQTAERTRAGTAAREIPVRPTITVNNLGALGGVHGTPLIVPPQIAIVAFGRIDERVVAINGQPQVRPTLPLTVGVDHRALDGDKLCDFMSTLVAFIENPALALARSV